MSEICEEEKTTSGRLPVTKIRSIHERAINLWIERKLADADSNPSAGILFALTDCTLGSTAVPENAIELCEAINQAKGWPALTDEERTSLNLAGILLFEAHQKGHSVIISVRRLVWARRIVYLLAIASLGWAGFSWGVIGLAIAAWWAHGAAHMHAQVPEDDLSERQMAMHAVVDYSLLASLCVVSIYRIFQHTT